MFSVVDSSLAFSGALLWPVLLLAVSAALIASRSVILATFSVIKLAVALDCFPRLKIIHTSRRIIGQIYIPFMNCVFMIMCVIITLSLREMHLIGYAYGKSEQSWCIVGLGNG